MTKTAIYALTPQGADLGKNLAQQLKGDLFLPAHLAGSFGAIPFDRLSDTVAVNFSSYPRQIFIAATGIVIRTITPHLRKKDRDPAIVVLDQEGEYVISLLSGHLGGANELAQEVALLTGGQAVITTATDTAGLPAFDVIARERDLSIANLDKVKSIHMAMLEGESIQIFDPEDRLGLREHGPRNFPVSWIEKDDQWVRGRPGVWVTWKRKTPEPQEGQLVLHPRRLVAGIGCNRGTESGEIIQLMKSTFKENDLALESLKCLATIEAKRDETGLMEAGHELGVPLVFLLPSEIESVQVPNPSRVVKKYMGVYSVCEATALLTSARGRLLVPKTKSLNATLAVALEG